MIAWQLESSRIAERVNLYISINSKHVQRSAILAKTKSYICLKTDSRYANYSSNSQTLAMHQGVAAIQKDLAKAGKEKDFGFLPPAFRPITTVDNFNHETVRSAALAEVRVEHVELQREC